MSISSNWLNGDSYDAREKNKEIQGAKRSDAKGIGSCSTADSRIRKYELDIIKPKDSMREKIAQALEVDLSAISDIDIATYEDVMQVLFLFEEVFGMDVEIRDGKTMLVFENSNRKILPLLTSLKLWRVQKTVMLNLEKPIADQQKGYELWKARFTPARKNLHRHERTFLYK